MIRFATIAFLLAASTVLAIPVLIARDIYKSARVQDLSSACVAPHALPDGGVRWIESVRVCFDVDPAKASPALGARCVEDSAPVPASDVGAVERQARAALQRLAARTGHGVAP